MFFSFENCLTNIPNLSTSIFSQTDLIFEFGAIISRGPLLQSVEITGNPKAIASNNTLPNPSNKEVKTNKSHCLKNL